ILRQFLQTAPDRARRHARRHRHRGNATISHGKRLRRRDQTTAPFIKKRRHRQKPLANGLDIDHNYHIWYEKTVVNSIFTLSEVDSIISGRALSAAQGPRRGAVATAESARRRYAASLCPAAPLIIAAPFSALLMVVT